MTDFTLKEIKGISVKNLIALLSSVILIEFTVLMVYSTVTTTGRENSEKIIILQDKVDKLNDEINGLKVRVSILEARFTAKDIR